jgi:hypothetical protein
MSEHFVIPDTQCKKGVPLNHLTAAGNYIVDKKPGTIIHLADHWDMPSLSSYDKGTKKAEGRTYQDDIDAGLEGMEALLRPLWEYNSRMKAQKMKQYRPRMVFTTGNHEERIMRHVNANPELAGKCSYDDFKLKEMGWEVYDFLEIVQIDGVSYSHFFANPNTGRPWGGVARTRLNNIGFSFTMGHQQGKDLAEKHLSNGKVIRALIVGSFYQHNEEYKGYQGNNHFRGCIYKHEVKDGNYCMMELSLDYLLREWL